VELTEDALTYGASQQEVQTGKARVYAGRDLLWVRPEEELKFTVRQRAHCKGGWRPYPMYACGFTLCTRSNMVKMVVHIALQVALASRAFASPP
jgi:hypothetical protein